MVVHSVVGVVQRWRGVPTVLYTFHSEILASINLKKNLKLVPWIGEQP